MLILVKVVLAVLIPDEPDWIRKKRERIEYTSMRALREQVNPPTYISLLSILVFFFICVTTFLSSLPETASRVLIALSCCFMLSCAGLLQPEDSTHFSVVWTHRGEESSSSNRLTMHTAVPLIHSPCTLKCFCCFHLLTCASAPCTPF